MSGRRTARTARRIKSARVITLAEYDPALAALDRTLTDAGWERSDKASIRRRIDGKVTGRVVWRRSGESIAWAATFAYQGSIDNG